MHVSAIQQFLRSLIEPLRASEAKQAILNDLELACAALDPFHARTLKEFADFLKRADEYDRTGVLKPPPTAGGRAPRGPKPPTLSMARALAIVNELYANATAEDLNLDRIQAELKPLDTLKKPELDQLAEQFGVGKQKTKKAALDAIERKITDRRNSFQRTSVIRS